MRIVNAQMCFVISKPHEFTKLYSGCTQWKEHGDTQFYWDHDNVFNKKPASASHYRSSNGNYLKINKVQYIYFLEFAFLFLQSDFHARSPVNFRKRPCE